MITMLDIARLAGVSTSTVSRVLTGNVNVAQATADKVRAVIAEHDFQRNPIAQNLRNGRNSTVALLVGDIEQSVYVSLTKLLQQRLGELGLDVMLYNLGHSESRLVEFLYRALALRLHGVILATPDSLTRNAKLRAALQELKQGRIPVLSVGQDLDTLGVPSVIYDEFTALRESVGHLLDTRGSAVAYLGRVKGSAVGTARLAGYTQAHKERGLPVDRKYIWDIAFRHHAGYEAITKAIGAGLRIQAIQAGSDELALGAMAALHDNHVRVPEDIAVVGLGDIEWASYVRPSISTLSAHPDTVAERIKQVFGALARGEALPETLPIPRTFIARQSG
jgi:DNA-binding LacI/PurR family transcriptional regulator